MKGLEKLIKTARNVGKNIKKNGARLGISVVLPFIFANNVEGKNLRLYNWANGVNGTTMDVKHIAGASDGYEASYDDLYNSGNPNPLHIYSSIYNPNYDLKTDSRSENHTTNISDPNSFIEIKLCNKGFSGSVDNYLQFIMLDDSNFFWKNIFFNINGDKKDIKYLLNNGSVYPTGEPYADLFVGTLQGSQTGVYNTGTLESFNYADLNRDGKVNGLDFAVYANEYGKDNNDISDPNRFGIYVGADVNDLGAYADIDRSGNVDTSDLGYLAYEWLWDANDPNTW